VTTLSASTYTRDLKASSFRNAQVSPKSTQSDAVEIDSNASRPPSGGEAKVGGLANMTQTDAAPKLEPEAGACTLNLL
jgi:hypothetical protein